MNKDQAKVLRALLSAVVPDGKVSKQQLDALVVYVSEVAASEGEAVDRISMILNRSVGNEMVFQAMVSLEVLGSKVTALERNIDEMSKSIPPPESKKLVIVQSIFIAISFIAGVVSLLKAFGLLALPW